MTGFKVLMVPEWYPWPHRPSLGSWGVERARAVGTRHDVVVLTAQPLPVGPRLWTIADAVEDGVRVVRVAHRRARTSKPEFLVRTAALVAAVRKLRAGGFEPDVVHATVFSAGLPALLLGRLCGAPVIVSEHYTGFPRGSLSAWDRAVARFTFRHADLVCPDSDDLGRHIAALGVDTPIRTMPNVVDVDEFRPAGDGRPNGAGPLLLNVASLDDKKGQAYLLRALADIRRERPGARLEIAGGGPLRESLERAARELGVADAVRFLGHQPKRTVAERMRAADVFVLPSLWENAPNVLIEAMASGLPCVATDVGGVAELVDDAAGRVVPARDPRALAEAVLAVLGERFDPEALAQRAADRHGYDAVAAEWTRAYSDVLAGR